MKRGPICTCPQCFEEWAYGEIERLESNVETASFEHQILLERYEAQKAVIRTLQEKLGRSCQRERPRREQNQVSL